MKKHLLLRQVLLFLFQTLRQTDHSCKKIKGGRKQIFFHLYSELLQTTYAAFSKIRNLTTKVRLPRIA